LKILAMILETFEPSVAFVKVTQIKRDESDSQSLTKILYHQKPLRMSIFFAFLKSSPTAAVFHVTF